MLSLINNWKLLERPLEAELSDLPQVLREKDGWMTCSLPCDVRMPLIESGVIKDPVLADYCFESEWVESRSWWFVREFDNADLDFGADIIELVIESIDACGDIFLNGSHIGHIENAFYPFTRDIKPFVVEGANILVVRVTTGFEQVSDKDLAKIKMSIGKLGEREDYRRCFLRKPAYTVGWDWAPRVVTCGIVGGAFINCYRGVVVRGVMIETKSIGVDAVIGVSIESESFDFVGTLDADYIIKIIKDGEIKAQSRLGDVFITSGVNFIDTEITLPDAKLWWPNGYGEQPLYDVEISVNCKGIVNNYPTFKYGIRTITLDCSRIDENERMFALTVNGVRIFCKGANWIPSDSIYARVTEEKYRRLVSESREANFNILRVWGGGLYESEHFYDACDEFGILVWQDFTFGCSPLPDHLEWFKIEVSMEMDYQTKRLRNHASLALWCGNNENHWIYGDMLSHMYDITKEKQYGLYTGNTLAVKAVRNNCPHIPYWNSSPYGGKLPNDSSVGDVHHWHECMMSSDIKKRIEPLEFDKVTAKFVSEYGYPGPCVIETIEQYHDGHTLDRDSRIWNLHNNTYEKQTVAAGIEKHYVDNAMSLPLEDYIMYAGMVQSDILAYSLECFRFGLYCHGGLFWMYNDAWGEVGWTIIDYYMRRKISFYGVKRAFEPVKLIVRERDGLVSITGCNDTGVDISFTARVGYISFDGKIDKTNSVCITIPKRSRVGVLNGVPLPAEDYKRGVFAVMVDDAVAAPADDAAAVVVDNAVTIAIMPDNAAAVSSDDAAAAAVSTIVSPAYLRIVDKRELILPAPDVRIISAEKDGDDAVFELTSSVFVHGVHVKGNVNCSDNYFDLLPGQVKTVRVFDANPGCVVFCSVI